MLKLATFQIVAVQARKNLQLLLKWTETSTVCQVCQCTGSFRMPRLAMFQIAAVHAVQARKNLQLVRGTKDVDKEFNDLVEFAKLAAECKHPWRTLFSKKYRPQLILSACSTGFQQWTGYVHMYFPPLFLFYFRSFLFSSVFSCILSACSTGFQQWTGYVYLYVPPLFLFFSILSSFSSGFSCILCAYSTGFQQWTGYVHIYVPPLFLFFPILSFLSSVFSCILSVCSTGFQQWTGYVPPSLSSSFVCSFVPFPPFPPSLFVPSFPRFSLFSVNAQRDEWMPAQLTDRHE